MPISSLVITLSHNPSAAHAAFAALQRTPGVTLGPCIGCRLALVLESASLAQGRETVEGYIAELEGVHHIDVIRIDFEDLEL
jgi:hypothetical protein